MGTPNFYYNTSKIYVIEDDTDTTFIDIQDIFELINEKVRKKTGVLLSDYIDHSRNYPFVESVAVDFVKETKDGIYKGRVVYGIRAGYYGGLNLDYEVEWSDNDDLDDRIGRFIIKLEKIFESIPGVKKLVCMGVASNGEAFYKRIDEEKQS